MAIRTKPLDEMLREIIASLQTSAATRPAFTLLLGSGFSYPIIPTPSQMLKGDVAWWRYCKVRRIEGPFRHRSDAAAAEEAAIADFERKWWAGIQAKVAALAIGDDGLPDLKEPESIGTAYQAVMSEGLPSNKMRRQYLRDAINRSHPKVNGAHIFLAGILEAQEGWTWGAPFCRTIFTTNFDPLLQRSLQLVNKLYYMTDRPEVLEPPDDDESDAIHLVYTHGSVHRYQLMNTGEQIEYARKRNAKTLVDYFERHGVVVIGYSGWHDTTMEALASCESFDSNLYWCDIHSAADAETKLRPEVLEILRSGERNAYYVPINGADDAMRQLHRGLELGDVPKFILGPIPTMISHLRSIEVPTESTTPSSSSSESDSKSPAGSLATLLDGTLKRLDVAKSAFDDPSIVNPPSAQGQEEVAKALAARLMSDAYVAYSAGKQDQATALWSSVITAEEFPASERAIALLNRGIVHRERGNYQEAIDDYTELLPMPAATNKQRAQALVNRGYAYDRLGKRPDAIKDYSAVIDMTDAGVDEKAIAHINRGLAHGENGDQAAAIADLSAVIAMPDAPADDKADALVSRSWRLFKENHDAKALVDDSRAALVLAPKKTAARTNLALGLLLTGDVNAAKDEYGMLVSQAPDSPVIQEAINDLQTEMSSRPDLAGAQEILALLNGAMRTGGIVA